MCGDNKLPELLKVSKKRESYSLEERMKFSDWIGKEENKDSDWTIVARSSRDTEEDLFTISALALLDEKAVEEILSKNDWEIRVGFGNPSFNSWDDDYEYLDGSFERVGEVALKPFVMFREFSKYIPSRFELLQEFILYHNAFWNDADSQWQFINDDGEIQVLGKCWSGKTKEIRVSTLYLKDFLAANKCLLVRYHDHRRFCNERITIESVIHRDQTSTFNICAGDIKNNLYFTRLLGKDIVFPLDAPLLYHYGFEEEEFVDFIIGVDGAGNEITCTCNGNELSNYFVDRGTPNYLTSVYFSRQVLKKYYDENTRFSVKGNFVKCLDKWHIQYDVNEENLVHVYLGDLGLIPYKEQMHWRHYNEHPRGSITEERFKQDFLAQWVEPKLENEEKFKNAYYELQEAFKEKFSDLLFLELNEADSHCYSSLRMPVSAEWSEFEEIIQSLAKVTVDSLNVAFLTEKTGQKIDNVTIKGSIDLLASWLRSLNVDSNELKLVEEAFRKIQSIRSSGVAHRKGEEFKKTLRRLELENASKSRIVDSCFSDLEEALNLILKHCRQD